MACYLPTILFLIGLMLDPGGNPFRLSPQVPADGFGLNILLQDPWMASHPPAVFLGYAAMSVPAALALAALFKWEESEWLDTGLRWSLIAFIALGVGIILGGFWAYKVLGWGGFWGWDPVENASLVPWIVVTALVHGLIVQKATNSLQRTNVVLALSGYLLVVYATFLTRSGVLADFSVHSFPKGTLYRWLVAGMLGMLAVSAYALIRRKAPQGRPVETSFSWPFLLSSMAVLLVMSASLVLIGTSWPILTSFMERPTIPSMPFYNRVSLPLYVVLLLALGVAPFSGWKLPSWRMLHKGVWISLTVAAAATGAAFAAGGRGLGYLLLFFAASFALTSNLIRLVNVARTRWLNTGAALSHLGFAMMIVGIVASSAWDREAELQLPLDQPVEALERTLTYRGHVEGSSPKEQWRIDVAGPGDDVVPAVTTMYQMQQGNAEPQLVREPAILRSLGHDVYLVPVGLQPNQQMIDLVQGQPARRGKVQLTFDRFETESMGEPGAGMRVLAVIKIEPDGRDEEIVKLPMVAAGAQMVGEPVRAVSLPGTTLKLDRMAVEQKLVRVEIQDPGGAETLLTTVTLKPLMNVLWSGTIVMALGCVVAATRRYVEKRAMLAAAAAAEPPDDEPRASAPKPRHKKRKRKSK
jgi:cytochrome c-type biogenesis protein CcmF